MELVVCGLGMPDISVACGASEKIYLYFMHFELKPNKIFRFIYYLFELINKF